MIRHSEVASFCFIFLALLPVPLKGQQERSRPQGMPVFIHGQVRFSQGGGTAENVLVQLESFSGGIVSQARTDRTGKFDFSGLSQAMYRVTVTAPGYVNVSQEVNLMTTANEYVILTLIPEKGNSAPRRGQGEGILLDVKVPNEAREEYEKGRSDLLNASDPTKGIPHLEKAVKIHPSYWEAELLLGTAYLDSHQLDKAQTALKRVLEIEPKTVPALLALGEVYREKKDFPEAEKSLQQGLKLDASSWQGHFTLGRVYWEVGNVSKAGAEIGRTLQLKPDAAEAYLFAGNIFLKANKAQEALQMFIEYLHLDPRGKYAEQTRKSVEKLEKTIASKK